MDRIWIFIGEADKKSTVLKQGTVLVQELAQGTVGMFSRGFLGEGGV